MRKNDVSRVALLTAFAGLLAVATAPTFDMARASSRTTAPVRGVVRALHQAAISIDLPIRVSKLHFREAESFRKGDVLVSFDCKRVEAEYAAAAAASREMKLTLQSQTYLDARGAVGKLDVEVSRARADKADAEAGAIAARLEQCKIVAPFDGRIAELKVNEFEVPPTGQPFIILVDESQFEIDLILPSHSVRVLQPGAPFQFSVDETGVTYDAKVLRVGASVDPVSQSIKVIGTFVTPDARIIAGMSGTAVVPGLEAAR